MRVVLVRAVSIAFGLGLAASWVGGCNGQTEDGVDSVSPSSPDGGKDASTVDASPKPLDGGPGPVTDDGGDGGKKPPKPKPDGGAGGSPPTDAGGDVKDALAEFADPGCPDAGEPINDFECDPHATVNPCADGEGCYPFVQYPDQPCGQEVYGAVCVSVGAGGQGDPCLEGCKAGHICVITGEGTQCVQMCDTSQPNPCPDGLVCGSVDVPGIGGCI